MINRRGLIVLLSIALLCVAARQSRAADLPPGITCDIIRKNYQSYKWLPRSVLRELARLRGYTAGEIKAAERCLQQ